MSLPPGFDWQVSEASMRALIFEARGVPVTYIPIQGQGDAVSTRVIRRDPSIEQPESPGYFADVEILEGAIADGLQRKDEVIWGDGTIYVVTKTGRRPDHHRVFPLRGNLHEAGRWRQTDAVRPTDRVAGRDRGRNQKTGRHTGDPGGTI